MIGVWFVFVGVWFVMLGMAGYHYKSSVNGFRFAVQFLWLMTVGLVLATATMVAQVV